MLHKFNMMTPHKFIFALLLFTLIYGCQDIRTGILCKKLTGKEIHIPQSLKLMNKQFLSDSSLTKLDNKIKLIISVPKTQCTGCRLSAHQLIDSLINSIPHENFTLMVIIEPLPQLLPDITRIIKQHKLNYPIYLDSNSGFIAQNNFLPKDNAFHSFLLDSNNKIKLIGDPSTDYNLMKLYQSVILDTYAENP